MHKTSWLVAAVTAFAPLAVTGGGPPGDGHHHDGASVGQRQMPHEDDRHASDGHASAVGEPAPAQTARRTVHVDLLDSMRFVFAEPLDLRRGEVVRFVVTNRGQIRHEFSVGSAEEQQAHRVMMRQMPDMHHADPGTVTVDPGQTRELAWRFGGDQPVVFACNIPGHAEAGMVATAELRAR